MFIAVFTRSRHRSLSWANCIQSTLPQPISLRSIPISYSHLRLVLRSGLFPSGFPITTFYIFLSYSHHMYRTPHSPWFNLPNNIWGGVWNMKLLIVQLSPFLYYFIPLIRIFSLKSCSQTPLVYALTLMWETKFHTRSKQLAELWFCIPLHS
jgi:hypothetical protein